MILRRASILLLIASLSTAPTAAAEPRLDLRGDPLPEGALARLGTLRLRHPLADHIAYTPDGRQLITSGDDGTVRVWEAATGKLLHTRRLPYGAAGPGWLSRDGNLHAVWHGSALEVWDLRSGERARTLQLTDVPELSALAFSANGNSIATADNTPREHRSRVWDVAKGTHRVVGVHEGRVADLVFPADGKSVITSAPEESAICCWRVEDGKELWRIKADCTRLNLSGDGKTLVIWNPGTSNLPLGIWDAETGKEREVSRKPDPLPFNAISLSADGRILLMRFPDHIECWDVQEGKSLGTVSEELSAVVMAPDGRSFAGVAGVLQRWGVGSGKALYPNARTWGHAGPVERVAWSPDSSIVATSSGWGTPNYFLWHAATGKVLRHWDKFGRSATVLVFMPAGKALLAGDGWGTCEVWDASAKEPEQEYFFRDTDAKFLRLFQAAVAPDSKRIIVAHGSLRPEDLVHVSTFEAVTGKRLHTWGTEFNCTVSPSISPDSRYLAGTGRVFDTSTGKELPSLETGKVRLADPVAFSRDGSLIAAGLRRRVRVSETRSEERAENVTVWERATGRVIIKLPTGFAGLCDFLPDGRTLATTSPDGFRLWDLATGKETFFRKAHDPGAGWRGDSFASALAVSPDGQKVATGHPDTTVLIWELPPPRQPQSSALTDADRDTLWAQLAEPEAAKAYAAIWKLADLPDQALSLVRDRLRAVEAPKPGDLKPDLADLDASQFRKREAASKRLAELGDAAERALRAALSEGPSAEKRQRLEALLAALDRKNPPAGDDLRTIRCIALLERIHTLEARRLIEKVAKGMESARATQEAQAALMRMK
jgi:WD40 repeat protein